MDSALLFGAYIKWHYTVAISDIFNIWSNILRFVYNFFSISLLFRTLFSNWRRIGEEREHSYLDIGELLSVFLVNLVMRFIGAMMRGMLIFVGLTLMAVVLVLGLFVLLLWLVLPLGVVMLIVAGLYLIVNGSYAK